MAQLKDLIVAGASRFIGDTYANKLQLTSLSAPTSAGGTTYGAGTNGNILRTNGTSLYWGTLAAGDVPNLDASKITSGTLPVNRGGTGATTFTSGEVLIGNGTSAIGTKAILNNTSKSAVGWNSNGASHTDNLRLINVNTLSYWNGAWSGTSSNLSILGTVTTGTWNGSTIGTAYGGTGNTTFTANRLVWSESATKLTASYHYVNSTKIAINSTSEPTQNFYVNGTSNFHHSSGSSYRPIISGTRTDKHLSIGNAGFQTYNNDSASVLYLNYYGGQVDIGSTDTASATRNFYGTFDFKSSNGFTYSGIGTASDNVARPVWFSYNGITGRPVYDNDFKYNPSTNTLTVGSITGNAATASAVAWANVTGKPSTYYTLPTATSSTLGGVKIGSGISIDNGTISVTASNLGLSNALHFIGVATAAITDGGTQDPTISGYSTKTAGDVVLYNNYEYVWTGSAWELLGGDSSYKVTQTAITDSTGTSETTTATRFVYSISQNANGVVSVKTRPLPTYNNYSLPTAASSTLGGIKTGYTTSGNNRAVQVDSSGNAYVVQKDDNTWRGIQDNLTSSSNTTESLSAKQGYLLANGSARDNTKVPWLGNLTSLGSGTPAEATRNYFTNSISNNTVNLAYNTSGTEYTLLFSRGGSASYGSVLKWGYNDLYIYALRMGGGSWKSNDWQKISAGYADTAGSASSADAVAWSGVSSKPNGTATPLMDGTAAVGTATLYSREDHVHPTDTSRMSATNPTGTGYFSLNRKINTTIGTYSFAEGFDATASGLYSHAEGGSTTASGDYSHAEGSSTTASGNYSHAEGSSTTASGNYSHAEGIATQASGDYSHAEGFYTKASNVGSHAEGAATTASNGYSHAEGYNTTASGASSHAEGQGAVASGAYSHAGGYYTIAAGDYQTAIGKYNIESDDNTATGFAFLVGNGTANDARSNAFEVRWTGNAGNKGSYWVGDSLYIHDKVGTRKRVEPTGLTVNSDGYSAVSVKTATNTNLISSPFSLPAGTWVLTGTASFASNATGRRSVWFSTSSAGSSLGLRFQNVKMAVNGAATLVHVTCILTLSSATPIYFVGYQNSGSNLNVTPRIAYFGNAS